MPVFDADNDEVKNKKYNWGYDPVNYNVPEGSYSTNPADPSVRIREFKQMVQSLHQAGIRVVLDVVYNHVFDAASSQFQKTVPDYSDIDFSRYPRVCDDKNPMHRLWNDGTWIKAYLAHGCYWHKCAFCDTSLDYICRYYPHDTSRVVDIMEAQIKATGSRGFHFVDEAAPPALLRKLAEEIIRRRLTVTYWTNVRFDSTFTPELCYLLAKSGCIAVSGGLEVASPRVLKLINKGVTIESATECMKNMQNNGIMVHTYLMYGFPTQTVGELFDSLKRVREMFAEGLIQSAFWHRFAMTVHAPAGIQAESYNARRIDERANPFANNEVPFVEDNGVEWEKYTEGLNLATYNYMRGAGFDIGVKNWFK